MLLEEYPRISVMVITYKQEGIIHRALDSLLAQKKYLYEICVSDDCSPDNTWQILLDYQSRYPTLIKLYRNESNRGIFENIEQVYSMPTGDIVMRLAGDDEVGDGWFKSIVEYIQQNNIDYKNELFCIYGDYQCIYPNKDSIIYRHSAILQHEDVFRLALRGAINGRGCCYSRHILDKFHKVSQGRSHIAENAQDRQLQIYALRNYYIPEIANVYYSRIGISTKLNDEIKAERMQIWPYSISCFNSWGIQLKKKDLLYIHHRIKYQEYIYWGHKRSLLISLLYYLLSFDLKIFLASNTLKGFFFAIRRRIPHRRVIKM